LGDLWGQGTQKGPHFMQPILNARLCHTLHRGLFSSKANGLLKCIRPEKVNSGNPNVVQGTGHFARLRYPPQNPMQMAKLFKRQTHLPFFDHKPVL